jgi:hypothetical protein
VATLSVSLAFDRVHLVDGVLGGATTVLAGRARLP